jgi:hypothetical protein
VTLSDAHSKIDSGPENFVQSLFSGSEAASDA